ncbi:zinc finger CCCH domain-containing protein 15-like protein isoform X2 [Cucumis melo var. makuwa]|uniref:Zinc finger CCCH domain-containing protein 15-like protein isoform X2 n=1 Tax=Cucumis melo var. makuwa TaxID=1194695 RepID=A0A5A7V7M2_CUCMM|nr:zinc finger CCCH domain-containing protein 15-like protein isoform X2 [Cucumis melo var. makuwa]
MGAEEAAMEQEKLSCNNPRTVPITEAQFLSWKRQKDAEASAKRDETARKRAEDIALGAVQMNGRDLWIGATDNEVLAKNKGSEDKVLAKNKCINAFKAVATLWLILYLESSLATMRLMK